ncbi:peptidase domain-containing ABC transporter [Candidatus Enterococcus ikei]|uniref:Peptidase domain-containing ABC transporter n=1 Tax=Candidatus Enterococcus ikei TaxID=2815326 RepID=A0ABS3GXK8_9ENTE|nr:peptidase domain-containing ABC transporter [Enterococcus sp. DIV0869a]MBO0439998.1 peptidase domain-containing ABC transporter [Enterococcus sp. DIV0869a]
MVKKVPFTEQSEHSECGLACAAMVLNYYNDNVTLGHLRDIYGVPKGGNTLTNLSQILLDRGIETKAIRVLDLAILKEQRAPVICFWEESHYVVLEKLTAKEAIILDPSSARKKIKINEFQESFSNIALILTDVDVTITQRKKQNATAMILKDLLKNQKTRLVLFIALTLSIQMVTISIPRLTQKIIDNTSVAVTNVFQIALTIVTLLVAYYLLQVSRGLVLIVLENLFDLTLMKKFMKKIIHLPLRFFVNRSTGDLIFRANLSVIIQQIMSQRMLSITVDFLFVFVYLILMVNLSMNLTLIAVFGAFMMGAISVVNSKKVQRITNKELTAQSNVQRILVELFEGMETVKSSGSENQFYTKWREAFKNQIDLRTEKNRFSTWVRTLQTSIQFILPIVLIYVGLFQVTKGQLTLGQLISFNALSGAFIAPIVTVFDSYTEFLLLRSYFGKLNEILEAKDNPRLTNEGKEISQVESLTVEDASFKYSHFEEEILRSISFEVKAGEKVAIVGKSGSGKSTLLKLLAGLYDVTSGVIKFNTIDLKQIDETSLKKCISIVNQQPTIFNASLYDNIVFDQENTTQARTEQAIFDSRVDEIIMNLPLGLETQISEGGMNLSGGQMQRISIARALVKETSLLLMDEPTSSLDNISENFIMNRLKTYDFTCIIVAHRLNTIKHFDRILVMDQGRIVEEGTHDTLLALKGYYHSIYFDPMSMTS